MSALDELKWWAAHLEARRELAHRTLLVSPELEEPVAALVARSWLSGIVSVTANQNLPEGSAYLIDERWLNLDLDTENRVEIPPHTRHPLKQSGCAQWPNRQNWAAADRPPADQNPDHGAHGEQGAPDRG